MRKFRIVVVILGLMFSLSIFGCNSETSLIDEDFKLEINLNTELLNENEEVVATAKFEYLGDKNVNISYSGGEDISSVIQIFYSKADQSVDEIVVSNKVENVLEKNCKLSTSKHLVDLGKGNYQIYAKVVFQTKNQTISIQSETKYFEVK